ncbi:hypothetical protein [Tenacibaculum finnmarkense]|uniref:Uncharacterized protein n=1 Tax=Tenacibaculum finnmarkense genomovar finnmarkense TaxID=1458503 RepID=A0AAP1RHJ9_9FLAO|nr:hypothetical protein [Tenacibaculum finnmarkense]MBE7653881.1 hypothetical protein [Tenacibaculum finnmarkense genomovar finnmarkense]MBE7696184.1 hypothetical protein [Tenacibaculum finnmarkense genomovar finnmarkense]MCD8428400.1 hypothetical protein [Tenacibaculum finnmarkense genomovar finnmarkense]MCG8732172.1 hypothetical protein [Tenacibaculum finnmarkense]MCG8752741.1 hypothetical protein [Tenacibaculum finnmarkense]
MKILNQSQEKVTIEFDLLDFDSLQEFFKEQKTAVNETGKFEYDAIQKILALELESSTFVNDIRLKRINEMQEENRKLLDNNTSKN